MESEQKSETKNESSIMDVPVGDCQASMLSTASQDDTNGSEENIENGGLRLSSIVTDEGLSLLAREGINSRTPFVVGYVILKSWHHLVHRSAYPARLDHIAVALMRLRPSSLAEIFDAPPLWLSGTHLLTLTSWFRPCLSIN
eukprot:scaffold20492_cov56-Attheya_sp.AAC.4